MKKLIVKWAQSFVGEDMLNQVHAVERIAILGFIIFLLLIAYFLPMTIAITEPAEQGRKVVAQRTLLELFLEKK